MTILTSFVGFKIVPSPRTEDGLVFRHEAFCRPRKTKYSKISNGKTKEPVLNRFV